MLEQLFRSKRAAEVTEGLAHQFADQRQLKDLGPNELFETFSAYCVTSQYHAEFEPDDLRKGQRGDLGIDAYAVIVDGALYTEAEDIRQAVDSANVVDVHFVLIQAKRERKFDGGVFGALATSILNIFSEDSLLKPNGPNVRNLRECVRAVYKDTKKFKVAGSPRLSVWYTSLGTLKLSSHEPKINAALARLRQSKHFRTVEFCAAGAHELRDLYRQAESMTSVSITMTRQVELPKMPGVGKALFGIMPACDVVDKILYDNEGRRQYLFHSNMREFLSATPVNTAIESTLRDPVRREQFAVLNNGITIVTSKLVEAGPSLHLTDPQIVNGCQTCNVLMGNRAVLSNDVMVAVRIIESSDAEVVDRIIIATNTQNALSPNAPDALHDAHKNIEDYFASRSDERKLYYERRLRQYGPEIPKSKIVTRRQLTQAYAATWLGEAHRASRLVFLEAAYQGVLYHPNDDPLPYYTAAVAQYRLAWLFGRPNGTGVPGAYRPARFHLLNGIKLYLVGDVGVPRTEKAVETICNPILQTMWHADQSRELVNALLPAVHTALGPDADLLELGQAVRTDIFAKRFQEAVLDLGRPARSVA